MPNKAIDIDGLDVISQILLDLLNSYPGLNSKHIDFSTLSETHGIGLFPTSGAAIMSEKEDVIGGVHQICLYPFVVVYRAAAKSDSQRLKIKEFLDTLGKWLEQQTVLIGATRYQLAEYPALTADSRVIKSIRRTNPSHLEHKYDDGIEDWSLALTLRYENHFNK